MDFAKSLFENCKNGPLVCAHRGSSAGNVPCNTVAAFRAALFEGADIIELDITKSSDGEYFVFHPGMENPHLHSRRFISGIKTDKVGKLRYVNQDDTKTQFGVDRLEDVFALLKDNCYINVDKFWTDIKGISEIIRKCGLEKQVIVKTPLKEKYLDEIEKYAPDFMFMPVVRGGEELSKIIGDRHINLVGAEVLFEKESDKYAQKEFIEEMHSANFVIFVNAIVYDYREVLSANHNDDTAFFISPDYGWGWLIDKGYDIIQTDRCCDLKKYISERSGK